jgi:hypothetical protein
VGSESDDWILLAAQLQPVLITDIHSAIAIPHVQQSLFTTIHTESISSSLHLQLLTPGTLVQLSALTACTHGYTLQYADPLHTLTD